MKVTLYSGTIQGGQPIVEGSAPAVLDRAVMAVYEGTFQSMDGEVKITADHIRKIAANHNANVQTLSTLYGVETPMKDCPPVQLDHSKGARDTVGRLVGPLVVDEAFMVDGKPACALLGTVRFLGASNVECASDGRWTAVSIGADLTTCILSELSVTPFPAAARASLLTKGTPRMKEKLKKYLMKSTKCSAEEADEKLSKLSEDDEKKLSAEADEDEKKLAAEDEEKKKLAAEEDEKAKKLAEDDEKDKDKKLAAARPKLVKLMGEAGEAIRLAKIETRKGEVSVRLSKLRGQGLLTPVEEQKLCDVLGSKKVRLSEASDDALDLVWAVLEAREPVIHMGQVGTVKPVDLGATGSAMAKQRAAKDEAVMLSNMPFTSKMLKATRGEDTEDDKTQIRSIETEPLVESEKAIEARQSQLASLQDQISKLGSIAAAITEALA